MFHSTMIRHGLAVGLISLLAACGQQPAPPAATPAPAEPARTGTAPATRDRAAPAFTLTEADADRALRLRAGQVVEVRLGVDRAGGFTWVPAHNLRPMMSTDGVPQYEADEAAGPGAPGTETWRFIALEPGHVHLVFEYRRPLEADVPPARTIVYHFDIE